MHELWQELVDLSPLMYYDLFEPFVQWEDAQKGTPQTCHGPTASLMTSTWELRSPRCQQHLTWHSEWAAALDWSHTCSLIMRDTWHWVRPVLLLAGCTWSDCEFGSCSTKCERFLQKASFALSLVELARRLEKQLCSVMGGLQSWYLCFPTF